MSEIKINGSHLLLQDQSQAQQEHSKLKEEKQVSPFPAFSTATTYFTFLAFTLGSRGLKTQSSWYIHLSHEQLAGRKQKNNEAHNHREPAIQALEE